MARVRRALSSALDRRHVIQPGERVLVACSGGGDSTALLDALAHAALPRRLELVVAHVDHGLRAGSAIEADGVAAQADAHGVPMHRLRAEVGAGPSLQERAREARHAVLRTTAGALGCTAIALGHTSDDQAETVLMRMLTTGSSTGVAGMRERAGALARPLLHVWRADTLAYCDALALPALDDPANADRRFLRARVRHDVLPALEAVFPGARRRLVTFATRQQRLLESAGRQQIP